MLFNMHFKWLSSWFLIINCTNHFCNIFVFLFLKSWLAWSTNNTVWFFSLHFICHFYFLWPKIGFKFFTPSRICCSRLFSSFYWFYFWLFVFYSCNLVTYFWYIVLILSLQVFSNFIDHLIHCFCSRNFLT